MTELEGCSGPEDSDADLLKKVDIIESEDKHIGRESKSRYHIFSKLYPLILSFKGAVEIKLTVFNNN